MIKKTFFLLIICQLTFVTYSIAQQENTTKKSQTVNDKFIVHKITKGETIFSICKKYDIDQKELISANPELVNGLKTGQTLNIPKKEKPKRKKDAKTDFIIHTVKQGETLYSLSKEYNVPIETIIKINPEAKGGVKIDQIIRIPSYDDNAGFDNQGEPKNDLQIKTNVIDYEVEEGDTFYSLMRKFGVTKEQLLRANPGINPDIKVGQSIKIPKIDNVETDDSSSKYIKHNVEPGETIYGLSTEYNVKVFEIMELNPGIQDRGLVSGETILIPRLKKDITEDSSRKDGKKDTKDDKPIIGSSAKPTAASSRDTFQISMFLPLFLNENQEMNFGMDETESIGDSMAIADNGSKKSRSLYEHSRNFIFFYEGVLIALDSMKKTGINIRLDLYDSQFKQSVVDSVLRTPRLLNSDLIVGPVDVKHQKNISTYSYKNQIPLVSPFSSDDDFVKTNPFYFQINPTKDYIYRKTIDFIGRDFWNKNVIVMTPFAYEQIAGGDVIEMVRERLRSNAAKHNRDAIRFSKVTIGEGYWEVKENLKKDAENVIFILPPTNKAEREAILSRAINNLYILSEEFDITLVGMSEYLNYKSINHEYFHKLKLHYLYPNYVNYSDPEVNAFIRNFRKKFSTEPNQYSYRGYDITKYFLEAYRLNGRNYMNKLSSSSINTLQSSFKMKRVKEFSGFVNRSLFVLNFTSDFEVKAVSTISD